MGVIVALRFLSGNGVVPAAFAGLLLGPFESPH
jgi:hypothetical protein